MRPFASAGLLLASLVAIPIAPAAAESTTADCSWFPASGVGAFGPFTIAFDLPRQVACVTWWCAPPGYADHYERSFVNWGGYLDATGFFTFYTNTGELLWNAKYAPTGHLVEAVGLDDYLWPMVASEAFTAVC